MSDQELQKILDGIDTAIRAGIGKAAEHRPAVERSVQAFRSQVQEHEKQFKSMQERVRKKLKSGARKTNGDPV